jgi:hypothetical protein
MLTIVAERHVHHRLGTNEFVHLLARPRFPDRDTALMSGCYEDGLGIKLRVTITTTDRSGPRRNLPPASYFPDVHNVKVCGEQHLSVWTKSMNLDVPPDRQSLDFASGSGVPYNGIDTIAGDDVFVGRTNRQALAGETLLMLQNMKSFAVRCIPDQCCSPSGRYNSRAICGPCEAVDVILAYQLQHLPPWLEVGDLR